MNDAYRRAVHRTDPDFVVFVPPEKTAQNDRCNMHFNVAPLKDGTFLATFTQASEPHGPDQRIVLIRSEDRGITWSEPTVLDAPEPGTENIASWSVLVPTPDTGRVWCLYHKNVGPIDYDRAMTGELAWRCSEDGGRSWSDRFQTRIGRGAIDHSDVAIPSNWVTAGWQTPITTATGVICPFTRWASRESEFDPDFAQQHHEGWFLRFDNIRSETNPAKLQVTTLPDGKSGIRIPNPKASERSAAMEPALQRLSGSRLLCLLRTVSGAVFYAVSTDGARSWSQPETLRFKPGGEPVHHPNAPIGLGRLADGRLVMLFHNNDGTINGYDGPTDWRSRNPVFISIGTEIEDPGTEQPVAFGEPQLFCDNGGPDQPFAGSLALYGTFFEFEGTCYWWYPDAIRFLLGKVVPADLLA